MMSMIDWLMSEWWFAPSPDKCRSGRSSPPQNSRSPSCIRHHDVNQNSNAKSALKRKKAFCEGLIDKSLFHNIGEKSSKTIANYFFPTFFSFPRWSRICLLDLPSDELDIVSLRFDKPPMFCALPWPSPVPELTLSKKTASSLFITSYKVTQMVGRKMTHL